jgi:two-component system NtrC family sensor kinase
MLNNAGAPMPAEGGEITLTTEKRDEQIAIHIADTGVGIKPDDMDRIFEPFFSTKSTVKGTGLGLSVSYGIIKTAWWQD